MPITALNQPLLALALATLSLGAQAHRPWMVPSSTLVEAKDAWVTVDAAISEGLFDIDHQPLKLDDLRITGPDGAPVLPENAASGHLRSVFDVHMTRPGTYKAAVLSQNVMASYQLNGEAKRWRGSEQAFATALPGAAQDIKATRVYSRLETFFSAATLDLAVFKPSGVGLELVPLSHPNDLRAGEQARWRFLIDGKPAANQAFSLVRGGVRYRGVLGEIRQSTDANGEISFTVPAPGMYLVSSSWPDAAAPVPGQAAVHVPRRVTYAATVEVLPQ